MTKFSNQTTDPNTPIDEKNFGSSNGKSIVLLNAILKNNSDVICKLLVSSTFEEMDKMLNSVFVQKDGRIIESQIDLIKLAVALECDPYIINMLKLATRDVEVRQHNLLFLKKLGQVDDNFRVDEPSVKLCGSLSDSDDSYQEEEE
jgi:hypothetical protein